MTAISTMANGRDWKAALCSLSQCYREGLSLRAGQKITSFTCGGGAELSDQTSTLNKCRKRQMVWRILGGLNGLSEGLRLI